jgi:aldehyde:ferredoxin oxidoreductase
MKSVSSGYAGQFLWVNLTTRNICRTEPPREFYKRYLGGRGFIVPTLLELMPPKADPLGPENVIIFALGTLTGHAFIGSGRHCVGAKSPLTGGYGESESGGFWGARLRRAGYDALIVQGVSTEPVYIWIDGEKVEIRSAQGIWGEEIASADEKIRAACCDPKASVSCIGPAGERLVRYACIINDLRNAAGRMGLGAVMGSKKLKAIAVQGHKAPSAADRSRLTELSKWMSKVYPEKSPVCGFGTGSRIESYEATGSLPIHNFSQGRFPTVGKIAPQLMFKKKYVAGMDGCFGCPLKCKRRVGIEGRWSVPPVYGGPEYETIAAFGSNCGVDDLEAIIKANELCNRYGLDTISTGATIAFAMECYEAGVIDQLATGGLELRFGNTEAMLAMIEKIGQREGLGDLLAQGTMRAAEKIGNGAAKFAMHIKGLELPMHEPRYKQGMGLHFTVHAAGPDHNTGVHDDAANTAAWDRIDLGQKLPVSELSPRKARMVYHLGLWRQLSNYLGVCIFVPWQNDHLLSAVEAVTGWPSSYWQLMKATERGMTLARIFNLREGFTQRDDSLPDRFFSGTPTGPLASSGIDRQALSDAQKLYYQMLGWDETGVPTRGRLVELDLEWACSYLQNGMTIS